jgi:hypothetical protein
MKQTRQAVHVIKQSIFRLSISMPESNECFQIFSNLKNLKIIYNMMLWQKKNKFVIAAILKNQCIKVFFNQHMIKCQVLK